MSPAGGKPRAAALLAVLGAVFLAAFALQRERSSFLAAEARAPEARALAEANGVPVREVLALLELLGGRLPPAELARQVQAFAAERAALGDELLAVLAVRGRRALALRLRAAAEARDELHRRVLACREAVDDAARFRSVAERFAARGH